MQIDTIYMYLRAIEARCKSTLNNSIFRLLANHSSDLATDFSCVESAAATELGTGL
jgi:hypothetical protein